MALELTKRFERLERGTLADLAAHFADADTKGEAVILVAGAARGRDAGGRRWQAALRERAGRPAAARRGRRDHRRPIGLKRKDVYDAALALKAEK